ncbi:MAG: hypothetical protein LE169_05755 [Endomicrobium sp.]|nr:hypothetical protein [Endomicrobium sp.]
MKFRLVGVDEDDKLRYHLGDGAYSACPEETIPFLQVNSFSYSLRQTLLPKRKAVIFFIHAIPSLSGRKRKYKTFFNPF